MNKSFIAIDCDQKKSSNSYDYATLISPAAVLNEKEVRNSLDFFSTKAPKKKQSNMKKKICAEDSLKNKRKRLDNLFSTIDLDGWSERNFVFPGKNGEDWHDDLHYIVLKQQERSNFLHQLFLFLMLALFCVLLITIAGAVYSKNSALKNHQSDQINTYEFIQKFIDDFNSTETRRTPDPVNQYLIQQQQQDDDKSSNENWLAQEANYFAKVIGEEENKLLNLSKKAVESAVESVAKQVRSVELIEDKEFRAGIDHSNLSPVEHELMMDEASSVHKISADDNDSSQGLPKKTGIELLFKQFQNLF